MLVLRLINMLLLIEEGTLGVSLYKVQESLNVLPLNHISLNVTEYCNIGLSREEKSNAPFLFA